MNGEAMRFRLRAFPRPSLQAAIWLLIASVATTTVALNLSELMAVIRVVKTAHRAYLPALAALEAAFLLNMGLFYATTFRASDVHAGALRFTVISAAAHFVNLVSKTSGLGGLALYLSEGRRNGDSSAKITAAYMAAYALGHAAFLATLILALSLLYVRGSLTLLEAAASAILFLLVIAVVVMVVAGLRSEQSLARLFGLVVAAPNLIGRRLLKRALFTKEKTEAWAAELYDALRLMRRRPAEFIVPFGFALGIELFGALSLFLVGKALNTGISIDTAVAGYALSVLFAILTVTPAGLGFVEASLVVFLASTGMTRQEAIAVTLGFRLVDFWLPVAIGALSLVWLRLTPSTARAGP